MLMLKKEEYYHVVQHVVDVSSFESVGFEVLLRHKSLTNPEELFSKARYQGVLVDLDLLSIMEFLKQNQASMQNHRVFFNIFPSTLVSPIVDKLFSLIQEKQLQNIVFELNESNDDEKIWGTVEFYKNLQYARELGIKIGIDDVGKGQSTLKNIVTIKPDYMKVDRFFASNLAYSDDKKQMISAFVNIASSSKSHLVLEGIETQEDYETAKTLGVPLVQGFYFGRPEAIKKLV